jgi:hypothetical protein
VGNVYDIVVLLDEDIPVTIPDDEITTDGLLLLHEPPGIASLNEVVDPTQRTPAPIIEVGNGLTAIT